MTQKIKNLHSITIDKISIVTNLQYNLNTNHIGIGNTYTNQKIYRDTHRNEIKKYYKIHKVKIAKNQKKYYFNNKDKINKKSKEYRKIHRNLNSTISGTKDHSIMCSCRNQGISINNFDGFIKDKPYCEKWTEKLRIQIRSNYNNCDYISGIHKDICNNGKNLDVHHVDYDKAQGCGKNFNLIPLSKSNHSKTNTNRYFWNKLFIYSLEYDKWYYGDNYD